MRLWVLPAHAGMIPYGRPTTVGTSGAPRTCGDDPYELGTYQNQGKCSPHMRG